MTQAVKHDGATSPTRPPNDRHTQTTHQNQTNKKLSRWSLPDEDTARGGRSNTTQWDNPDVVSSRSPTTGSSKPPQPGYPHALQWMGAQENSQRSKAMDSMEPGYLYYGTSTRRSTKWLGPKKTTPENRPHTKRVPDEEFSPRSDAGPIQDRGRGLTLINQEQCQLNVKAPQKYILRKGNNTQLKKESKAKTVLTKWAPLHPKLLSGLNTDHQLFHT